MSNKVKFSAKIVQLHCRCLVGISCQAARCPLDITHHWYFNLISSLRTRRRLWRRRPAERRAELRPFVHRARQHDRQTTTTTMSRRLCGQCAALIKFTPTDWRSGRRNGDDANRDKRLNHFEPHIQRRCRLQFSYNEAVSSLILLDTRYTMYDSLHDDQRTLIKLAGSQQICSPYRRPGYGE